MRRTGLRGVQTGAEKSRGRVSWRARIKEFFFDGNNDIIKPMETKIRKIDKNQIDETVIREAGDILKAGGLVDFPTETVYGLGADALKW